MDPPDVMRKELLKSKTRHQSAGTDGKSDEGFEAESEQGTLRRRKPVSLTSAAEANTQRQQRFSLPIPDNFHRPMAASRLYKVIGKTSSRVSTNTKNPILKLSSI